MAEAPNRAALAALSLLSAIAAAACASLAPEPEAALVGPRWQVQSIDGRAPVGDRAPHVRFTSDRSINGFGGCNSFFGRYEAQGAALRIEDVGRTEMACAAPIMAQEDALLNALGEASHYNLRADDALAISTLAAHTLVLTRTPA